MIVTGYFPDYSNFTAVGTTTARRKVSDPDYREVVDVSVLRAAVAPKVLAASGRDAQIYLNTSETPTHFGPFSCILQGNPIPPPPTRYIELFRSKSNNNGKRWKAHLRTKDIIVSPYSIAVAEFSYSNGRTETQLQPPIKRTKYLHNSGLFPVYSKNTRWIIIDGWIYETSAIQYTATYVRATEEVFTNDPTGSIASSLTAAIGDYRDGALVATTLASANRGTIDALTAMAEFPETLRSILDGVKLCMKIYRDARIKSFRLYNKAKRQQNVNQSQATLAKNARELADAIANVWLNFRYNIMPNVYLIEDLIKTLNIQMSEFIKFRETRNYTQEVEFSTPLWDVESQAFNTTHRVMIKRLIDVSGKFPKIKHLVLTNVFVTGYELVPYSFVYDWFINLGDIIAAFLVTPEFTQEGATYSWKTEGSAQFSHKTNNAGVSVNLKAYKCSVINPRNASCLAYNPKLNWMRQADALALTWSAFKDEISKTLSLALRTKQLK